MKSPTYEGPKTQSLLLSPLVLRTGRRIVISTDPSDETKNTNVFLAFTPTRPDYSSLGSFGTRRGGSAMDVKSKKENNSFVSTKFEETTLNLR